MPDSYAGFFEYRRERYDFDSAIAHWDGHRLDAYASGSDALVYFCGIPFGPVDEFAKLNGQTFSGNGSETVFSEGLVRFFEKNYSVEDSAEIRCVAANLEKGIVSLEFEFEIALGSRPSRRARGGMRCVLGEIPALPDHGLDE